jgi:DNA gyrase subunit A
MSGSEDLIMVTQRGQALRFSGDVVRIMGRTASGVYGIKLDKGDRVCSAGVIDDVNGELLVVTAKGYGKRSAVSEFAQKGRNGKGVRCLSGDIEQTGVVSTARVIHPDDEVTLITKNGMVLRKVAADIPQFGRATRGSKMIELGKGDEIRSVAVLKSAD